MSRHEDRILPLRCGEIRGAWPPAQRRGLSLRYSAASRPAPTCRRRQPRTRIFVITAGPWPALVQLQRQRPARLLLRMRFTPVLEGEGPRLHGHHRRLARRAERAGRSKAISSARSAGDYYEIAGGTYRRARWMNEGSGPRSEIGFQLAIAGEAVFIGKAELLRGRHGLLGEVLVAGLRQVDDLGVVAEIERQQFGVPVQPEALPDQLVEMAWRDNR